VALVALLLLTAALLPAAAPASAAAAPWFGPWFKHVSSFWTVPQNIFKPVRLAVSADHVWVADQEANRVVRFDLDGGSPEAWTGAGTTGAVLKTPNGLALNNDGSELFVADTGNHRIVVVSTEDWSVLHEIGSGPGAGNEQFDSPNDIDVWAGGIVEPGDGVLFVADTGNDRVVRYGYDTGAGEWQYAGKWGSSGAAVGQFRSPSGIAVDHHQMKVWVADTDNDRVQVFEQDGGAPLRTFGTNGSGAGQFRGPQDLAFIPSPLTLLVADENNNRIQEWSIGTAGALTVTYWRAFGSIGTSGAGKMSNPQGVAVDKWQEGDMYVADTYNHRVQLWRRDTVGPRTYAYKTMTVKRYRYVSLKYKLTDSLTDKCYVTIKIYRRGKRVKTHTVGWRDPSSWRTAKYKCNLAPGNYIWKVYAKDRAGNNQRSPIGYKGLVVKR